MTDCHRRRHVTFPVSFSQGQNPQPTVLQRRLKQQLYCSGAPACGRQLPPAPSRLPSLLVLTLMYMNEHQCRFGRHGIQICRPDNVPSVPTPGGRRPVLSGLGAAATKVPPMDAQVAAALLEVLIPSSGRRSSEKGIRPCNGWVGCPSLPGQPCCFADASSALTCITKPTEGMLMLAGVTPLPALPCPFLPEDPY